jgi:outer membrane protein OmpA-like peptidoglycan-associated protein
MHGQSGSNAIGVQLSALDFYGPQTGHYLFQQSAKSKRLFWDPALQFNYLKAVSTHLQLKFAGSLSSLLMPSVQNDSAYILSKVQPVAGKSQLGFVAVDAGAEFSFLSRGKFICTPLATAGAGYYFHKLNNGVSVHAGLGLNCRISENLSVIINSDYHYSLSNRYQTYLQHSIGLSYTAGKNHPKEAGEKKKRKGPKKQKPVVAEKITTAEKPVEDTDNDGIADDQDNCITEPGRKETFGCPDRDKDGVADKQDLCPDVRGSKSARGCPDADNDGVTDEKDQCPDLYGKGSDGCPVEEIAEIKSPVLPDSVLAENNLKAEEPSDLKEIAAKVKDAAAQILFNSGTAYIHPSSYYALDTIVRVLKNDPLWHVDIEGHTDNTGGEKQNLLLSQQRADACKEYLIRAGISENRISAIGYGDLNPIADNSSEEGRKINRRTEFLLFKPGP